MAFPSWCLFWLPCIAVAETSGNHFCSDALGSGVSFLQASKKLWAAPPASSSLTSEASEANNSSSSNDTNATIDITAAVNYSEMADHSDEVKNETSSNPYSKTNSTEEAVPLIQPINDAVPLSDLDEEDLTGDLRDCIMGCLGVKLRIFKNCGS